MALKKFDKAVKEALQGLTTQKSHGWDSIRNFTTQVVRSLRVPVS